MKVTVKVMLKDGVLDPQGAAVEHALHNLGHGDVADVRIGRLITFEVGDDTREARIREMCDRLLANPVIEDYEIAW